MSLTTDEITKIANVMNTLDRAFPKMLRTAAFPSELDNLDLIIVMPHGVIILDEMNQVIFKNADARDNLFIEKLMHPAEIEVECPDDYMQHDLIKEIEDLKESFVANNVKRVYINITDRRPTHIRRIYDYKRTVSVTEPDEENKKS